jgi:hypothetical protein
MIKERCWLCATELDEEGCCSVFCKAVQQGILPCEMPWEKSITLDELAGDRFLSSNNMEFRPDLDYQNMILICKSLDPTINPKPPSGITFDFTISPNMIR